MVSRRQTLIILAGAAIAPAAGFVGARAALADDLPPPGANITSLQAYPLVKDGKIALIDIRLRSEWRDTGIAEGAVPITMHQPLRFFIAALERQGIRPGDSKPVALICAHGIRSRRLQAYMQRRGFSHVIDVGDGTLGSAHGPGWRAAGLPMYAYK